MIFQQEQNILPEVHWGQPGGCSCAPQDLGSPPGSPLWDIDNGGHGGGGDYVMQSCCGSGVDIDNDFRN